MQSNTPHGFLLIDKEPGLTSAAVISRIKKKFHLDKIGHAGTLDPFATGLLVALIGNATRLSDYVMGGRKVYSGIIALGASSSTDDCTGTLTAMPPPKDDYSESEIQLVIDQNFLGEIEQTPPKVSAKKVKGKRAYDLARENQVFELSPSKVSIESFTVKKLLPLQYSFMVACGKGTYIRALARDIGSTFGTGGVLNTLRREESDPFSVKNAKKLDDIEISDILPWWSIFGSLKTHQVSASDIEKLAHGNNTTLQKIVSDEHRLLLCDELNTPKGLAQNQNGEWRRIFWI